MAPRLTLTAFCDLQHCPVSFDFVTWLVRAMLERDRRQCDGLHVVVVPHETGLGGFSRHWGEHDEAAARWRLWHIVVASCPLARATVTVAASRKHAELMHRYEIGGEQRWCPAGPAHFMGPLVDAARNGERIPRLRATEQAHRHVGDWLKRDGSGAVVTLTLRNQSTDPARNSNVLAWDAFAKWLQEKGWRPIILNDTHIALSDGRGYAELDPDLRLALYEQARMNFIGNNGPQELLKFSDARYRIFLDKGWPEHWRKHFHMEIGEQFPWAGENQRVLYQPDTFEVMRESWERAA